jgi:predicted esterase
VDTSLPLPEPAPKPHRSRSLFIFLFLGVCGGIIFTFLTIVAILLGGIYSVFLGISAITFFSSLGLIYWKPRKKWLFLSICLFCTTPLYLLLPNKPSLQEEALIQSHSIFEEFSPWFQGIPEKEIIHMGENWGYTTQERNALAHTGTLADSYDLFEQTKRHQYDYSILLDSWFKDRGHYWFLKAQQQKAPLLIFLHGSGGNFKAYQHWFAAEASKKGIAMAFPSWGLGLWSPEKLNKRLEAIIKDIQLKNDIDPQRIFICGLSQGSFTGLKALALGTIQPQGFIAVSGVPEFSDSEIKIIQKTPLYIIHGTQDERAPIQIAKKLVNKLRKSRVEVLYSEYTANHTLIKVKNAKIVDNILNWVRLH